MKFLVKKEEKNDGVHFHQDNGQEEKGKRCTYTHMCAHTHRYIHMRALTFAQSLLALSPLGLLTPKE